MSKLLTFLSYASSLFFGLFLLEKSKNGKLQSELNASEFKNSDEILVNQQNKDQQIVTQEQKNIQELNKNKDSVNNQDPLDFWNNTNKKE